MAEEHGEWVGIVWIGPAREGFEGFWVYDVTVAERHRGRGFGRSLMVEAERLAREAGQARLGLNVFGGNAVAIRLYSELGYHVDAQQMSKALDAALSVAAPCSACKEPVESAVEVQVVGLRAQRHQIEGGAEEGSHIVVRRLEQGPAGR